MPKNLYVGVAGFERPEQVLNALENVPTNTSTKLGIIVLANEQTLNSTPSSPQYVDKKTLSEIFTSDVRALNLIHFNTSDKENALYNLAELVEVGGDNLHGFQMYLDSLSPDTITELRDCFPEKKLKFIVPLDKDDFQKFSPKQLAEEIEPYNKLIDYILLDHSVGSGEAMNPTQLLAYAKAIYNHNKLPIVIAGGLCGDNMGIIQPIIETIPISGLHAHGQLHNEHGLDMKKTSIFIKEAFEML